MNLSGSISDWTVADLLNMLRVTSKTASVEIRGRRSGMIHFREGRVAGAVIDGDAVVEGDSGSRVSTVDALFVLSSLPEGTFELKAYSGPKEGGWEVDEVVADMARLNELESDVSESDLADRPMILKDEIGGPVTIDPDDWWAFASLVSVISLEQLEGAFGRARAIRLLHTLWRLGVVEAVAGVDAPSPAELASADSSVPNDEAWLDEIAAKAAEPAGSEAKKAEVGSDDAREAEVADGEARKRLTGVAAPASTVLTGSVLDEMRRLRGRSGD
jgi:hypothetical protein